MATVNKRLTVYDPRLQERCFETPDGGHWSSKDSGVLFFETDHYASYTSPEYIEKLLDVLISESNVAKLGLRISNFKLKSVPSWVESGFLFGSDFFGIFDVASLGQAIDLFREYADYQRWNFYGLLPDFKDFQLLETFPEVLKNSHLFPFVVELDLDGILMGYVRPRSELDQLISRLESLAP